jgi:Na+/proline symporter
MAARICSALLMVGALLMATYLMGAAQTLGNLALSFSFQLWPGLLAILWLHWIPRRAVLLGLIAGMVAVVFTEPLGQLITGDTLPWGRWPWTIHSAAWGMFFNVLICLIVAISGKHEENEPGTGSIQRFLKQSRNPVALRQRLKSVAWLFALIWAFFAVGPGLVIGNDFFGRPDEAFETWMFRMPSIWAWQIIWWAIGVGMIWFLANKMELSTSHDESDDRIFENQTQTLRGQNS